MTEIKLLHIKKGDDVQTWKTTYSVENLSCSIKNIKKILLRAIKWNYSQTNAGKKYQYMKRSILQEKNSDFIIHMYFMWSFFEFSTVFCLFVRISVMALYRGDKFLEPLFHMEENFWNEKIDWN